MRQIAARTAFASVLLFAATARAQAPACAKPVTSCDGDGGYYVAPDDRDKVQKQLDPLLKELRTCLDAAGGRHVTPGIVIRFDSDGTPVTSKVDAGGYDSLPCVASVSAKLVNARSVRETAMRCEYGCPRPKPPAPTQTPPVVVPPAPATATPTQPATTEPPPPAQVQPAPPAVPPPQKKTVKIWYGWQNLIADGVSGSLIAIGVGTKTSGITTAGALGFVFGSPVVHWVHGNVGPGFGSLGMRILLPPIGFAVGLVTGLIVGAGRSNNSLDEVGSAAALGAYIGGVSGMLIPVAIDAAALGYEKVEAETESKWAHVGRPQAISVAPSVSVGKTGGTVGLGGTF